MQHTVSFEIKPPYLVLYHLVVKICNGAKTCYDCLCHSIVFVLLSLSCVIDLHVTLAKSFSSLTNKSLIFSFLLLNII